MPTYLAVKTPPIFNDKAAAKLDGVHVKDGQVLFDASKWTEQKAAAAMRDLDQSLVHLTGGPDSQRRSGLLETKAFTPTEADYAAARANLKGKDSEGNDIDVTKFGYYETIAADTLVDLVDDRFTRRFLDALAPQAKAGLTVLLNHHPDHIMGATYDARVEPIPDNPENYQLVVKFYVPNFMKMPKGEPAVDAVNTGTVRFTSVGFKAWHAQWIEAGDTYVREYDHPDGGRLPVYVEHSLAYRGAQLRAALKSAAGAAEYHFSKTSNSKQMPEFQKSIRGRYKSLDGTDRHEHVVKVAGGDNPTADGLDAVQTVVDGLVEENRKLAGQLKAVKEPLADQVNGLEKQLEISETAKDRLLEMDAADLQQKKLDLEKLAGKTLKRNQVAGQGAGGNADPDAGDPGNAGGGSYKNSDFF